MAKRTSDPSKVRLFPEYPASTVRAIWDAGQEALLSQFPNLSAAQRAAMALRRFQEHLPPRPNPNQ